jgi:predicted O-methyltransferase YrrM
VKSKDDHGDARIIERSGLFDAEWYLSRYEDVARSGEDPLAHFSEFGWTEGRLPNFYFDPAWYLATYEPDAGDGGNPLIHYILHGEREGARPSPHFDPEWYRDIHALDADTSPLRHLLLHRTSGLVSPLPDFDVEAYCADHAEVLAEGRDPYEDYVTRAETQPVDAPSDLAPVYATAPLPKFAAIESLLGLEPDSAPPNRVPWDSVVDVLRLFVECIPVDEAWYRENNPDVDEAIRSGDIASAKEHFVSAGYFEGRAGRADDGAADEGGADDGAADEGRADDGAADEGAVEEAAADDLAAGIEEYLRLSEQIPGWTRGIEAEALAERAYALPDDAAIVEIGCFLGSGAVLLAGARKLRGSGRVHCVDPFDGSRDEFSVPRDQSILGTASGLTHLSQFHDNIGSAGLADWIDVHEGTAVEISETWDTPIDFLFLDGDHSAAAARSAYLAWSPWLRVGGTLAIHNSNPSAHEDDHDGHFRVAQEFVTPPEYDEIELIGTTTFARKAL